MLTQYKSIARNLRGEHQRWMTKLDLLRIAVFILLAATLSSAGWGAGQAKEPRILGVAHIAYYVSDLDKARAYYEGFLGFQEAFSTKEIDGSTRVVYIKINDRQFIVLFVGSPENHGYLHDAAFETNDAKGMRTKLANAGYKVSDKVAPDPAGDLSFDVTDPSGFTIEVVQYQPKSLTGSTKGKFMLENRISTHIDHLGLLVDDQETSWKFYSDAFGFEKEGDGSKMKIGDGPDRFELGHEKKTPTAARYHVKNHICLSVPDVPKVTTELRAKPEVQTFPDAIADTHQLGNGKNVVEIYDLDRNRVELMEPPKGDVTSASMK